MEQESTDNDKDREDTTENPATLRASDCMWFPKSLLIKELKKIAKLLKTSFKYGIRLKHYSETENSNHDGLSYWSTS
jgi:hypothetical protein